jgi:RluA family pseudouridine synthase
MNGSILRQRNDAIARMTIILPGSIPYDNFRPINVSQRYDRMTLLDVVCGTHPHIGKTQWLQWFAAGHLLRRQQVVQPDQVVRGGQQYQHLFPNTTEPEINADIRVIHEDPTIVVVDKPAPLPMHPSGRFNKNTLTSILSLVYPSERLLPAHRLDANTRGIVLFSRTARARRNLQYQFESHSVGKIYHARCWGHPNEESFVSHVSIGRQQAVAGGREFGGAEALDATTKFRVLERFDDGTSLVEAKPITGRTNQIRIHLWEKGFPIVGDPLYLRGGAFGQTQTKLPTEPPMHLQAIQLTIKHPTSGETIVLENGHTS